MHEPYENRYHHKADFRVKYRFRNPEDGGRRTGPPYQGIRCDFSIESEAGKQQYRIWPEFEDSKGEVILQDKLPVPQEGTALMWVGHPNMRPYHYDNIVLGLKCHFREGSMYSADCEVIEILDLKKNPTESK